MTVKTSTAPELTAEQVAKILVQPLEERSQFLAAGPHIFDTAGPFACPRPVARSPTRAGPVSRSRSPSGTPTSMSCTCCRPR